MRLIIRLFLPFFVILCICCSCGKQKNDAISDSKTPFTFTPVPIVKYQEPEKEYVNGIVEKESGDLYIYLEKPGDYYTMYPEKKDTSFNMWELTYYLDLNVGGTVYKGIELYVDPESNMVQYVARDVGELCYAIKKGSKVKINKEAWDNVISGQKYLLPDDVIVRQ